MTDYMDILGGQSAQNCGSHAMTGVELNKKLKKLTARRL